jgi:3-hydroxybutyrate dehydrogenase
MLKGKFALVTGSTSGIGLGIAHALAAAGCGIVIEGLATPAELQKLGDEFKQKYGVPVVTSDADLGKEAGIVELVEQSLSAFGRIDILVNNAGIQFVAPIDAFPTEKWEQIMAINLTSAFLLTKSLVPSMKANGFGRIVNIASAHGLVASANKSAYVASKHGLLGLTKVTALDYANTGITANAICPGWVRTPLVEKQLVDKAKADGISVDAEAQKFLADKQPLLEFSTPEDLGALTVFLCSDAARTMTGSIISMDGGWTAQ